jgi:hypothetical protein
MARPSSKFTQLTFTKHCVPVKFIAVPSELRTVNDDANAAHEAIWLADNPRHADAVVVRRARAFTWAVVLGWVGMARWRTYWPDLFRDDVRAPTEPDWGTSRIFILPHL